MDLSLRKALNLVESWLLSVVDEETWNNEYKHILSGSTEDVQRMAEVRERWKDAGEDGRGEFKLVRKNTDKPSNFSMASAKPQP